METVVSKNNLEKLLIGIVSQYRDALPSNKISMQSKDIDSLFDILTSGDGNKLLANNGEYKDLDMTALDANIKKFNTIQNIMRISKTESGNYQIYFEDYDNINNILKYISTSGDGTKVLADNGEYVELVQYTGLTDEEINNMINSIEEEG